MARKPNTQSAFDSQAPVPTYLVNTVQAELAWDAYKATQLSACANPALLANPYFTALQDTAYARFRSLFEVL